MVNTLLEKIGNSLQWFRRTFSALYVRIEKFRVQRAIKKIPTLWRLYSDFLKEPEAKWTVAENDILALYTLVKKHKPRAVLELGTGVGLSGAVIALALQEIGEGGTITSLEQSEKCVNIARNIIPAYLKNIIQVIHAKPNIFKLEGVSEWAYFSGYDWNPPDESTFDLVFIDGPAAWIKDGRLVTLNGGDIFKLIPHIATSGLVYIDGRRSIVREIERYLGLYLTVIQKNEEFTILQRTNEPVKDYKKLKVVDRKLAGGADLYERA